MKPRMTRKQIETQKLGKGSKEIEIDFFSHVLSPPLHLILSDQGHHRQEVDLF